MVMGLKGYPGIFPEYSLSGIEIESAIAGMTYVGQKLTLESFEVHSPEIQANGVGWLDFEKRSIDMDVFLRALIQPFGWQHRFDYFVHHSFTQNFILNFRFMLRR